MRDTIVPDCKGFFYDSQGPSASYLFSEDYTFTINNGGVISMFFNDFFTEINTDSIRFFDGPDTLSPQIGPSYSGGVVLPTIVANSGALTIHFSSDANVQRSGWEAYWTTIASPPVPPMMSISPAPSCSTTTVELVFTSPVPCDSIEVGDFTINGLLTIPIQNVIPQNCLNDSTTSIHLILSSPLDENCNYTVDYNLELRDACDSIWSFLLNDSFMLSSCPPKLTIEVDEDTICVGACATLEAILPSCLNYNYNWNNGLASNSGPFTVCPSVSTTYTVTVQDIGATGPAVSSSITIHVLDAKIISSDTTLCQSDSAIILTALHSGGIWRGIGITDSIGGVFDPDSAGPGTHFVRYNMNGFCEDTLWIEVKPIDAGLDEAACPGSNPFLVGGFSPNGGIWTGDSIQSNGLFNPLLNGIYTITYTYNGCSEDKKVYVDNISGPIQKDTVCQSLPPYDISISPFGGKWFGAGIIDSVYGTFDPDEVGGGLQHVEYHINGCVDTFEIFVNEIEVSDKEFVCPYQSPLFITPSPTPLGGWWKGIGVLDSITGWYDPGVLGFINGWDTLVYEIPNGCQDTMLMRIRETTIGEDSVFFCIDDDSMKLNWATVQRFPFGGLWSGAGLISNLYFKPSLAGPGTHTLFYTANECTDSIVMVVYPEVISLDTLMCSSQPSFIIQQMPPGGHWWANGAGIIDSSTGLFDPSVALQDTQFVYFDNPAGCVDSVLIAVYPFEAASISGLDSFYCFKDQDFQLVFTPATASIIGPLNNNHFNPTIAGEGQHSIMVEYGSGVCYTMDSLQITVLPELTSALTATEDTICFGQGVQLTVTASGGEPGVLYTYSWNQGLFPIESNNVNPQVNTTYVSTVSDGCSDDAVDSINIIIAEQFDVSFETSDLLCYGLQGYAKANVSGSSNYAYHWSTTPIQTSDSLVGFAGDSYTITITDLVSGCTLDTLIKVPNYSIVNALFSISPNLPCVSYEQKDILRFIDLSNNVDSGYWDFGNDSITNYVYGENPSTSFTESGYYNVSLTAYNEGGCMDEYSLELCIYDPADLFVADAFSPNGDGINDVLYVRANGISTLDFFIFNRWGKKVFESHSIHHGWDGSFEGKDLNTEVFIYHVSAVTNQGEIIRKKGNVTLIK